MSDHKRETALISRLAARYLYHDWQDEGGQSLSDDTHYFIRPSVRFNYTFNLARAYRNRPRVRPDTTPLMTRNSFKRALLFHRK